MSIDLRRLIVSYEEEKTFAENMCVHALQNGDYYGVREWKVDIKRLDKTIADLKEYLSKQSSITKNNQQ